MINVTTLNANPAYAGRKGMQRRILCVPFFACLAVFAFIISPYSKM
jgi:hypothetical protein